jgi:outer membrane protein TolC
LLARDQELKALSIRQLGLLVLPMLFATVLGAQTPGAGSAAGQSDSVARADTAGLSLEDAVRRAVQQSQEVRLARSQVEYAGAAIREARADLFPQISGSINYTRTFESSVGGGTFVLPDSLQFDPDPTAPLEDRVRYLEQNATNAGLGGLGALFGNLPFGRDHAYTATLSGSQTLFSPRLRSAIKIAGDVRRVAELGVTEQRAEIELQVRTAYYRALLAREIAGISQAAVAQAQKFLDEERLRERAGTTSDLEVLRAQVSLANLQPQLVEATNAAELAELELKRLVDIPLSQPLVLTSTLAAPSAEVLAQPDVAPELEVSRRAAIEAAERQVAIRRQQVSLQKASFLPSATLRMNYGGVNYPTEMFGLGDGDWRTDWNLSVGIEVPIFSGFRRLAQVDGAQAQLEEAELELARLEESVQLQYQQARSEKARARASIAAREQTVTQAQRVYELTELRYERGLATQLEVSDARLALLQARTNLAQALADFYVADAGVVRATGATTVPQTAAPGR